MADTDLAQRIVAIENRLQELKSVDTPGNYTSGAALFGGTSGSADTDATNYVWDNTNKRLGVGTNAPAAKVHAKFAGGSAYGLRVELTGASGDTLLDLFNSDSTIGSGSNFLLARDGSTTYAQIRGDGLLFAKASLSVGVVGTDLLYAESNLAGTKLHLYENSGGSGSAHIYLFAGQPGVSFNAGGVSFNWRQTDATAMGRQDTGTGAAFLRLLSNQADLNVVTTSGTALQGQIWDSSGGAARTGFLGATPVARQSIGAAASAGGTGATAGAYDTAAHRDALITLVNNIRTALINFGLCTT